MNVSHFTFATTMENAFWEIANQKGGYSRNQARLLIQPLEQDLQLLLPTVVENYHTLINTRKAWGCHQANAAFLHALICGMATAMDNMTKTSVRTVVVAKER